MHGQKCRARGLGKLHKILPAIRILSRVPQHAGNFFTLDIAEKAAHAQAFDEGCHIVLHAGKIVRMWSHGVSLLYGLQRSAANALEPRVASHELRATILAKARVCPKLVARNSWLATRPCLNLSSQLIFCPA